MRHRIEHIELIDRADVPRLAALGITASLQPAHPPGAMDFPIAAMETVFAPDRWKDAYLCRDLAEAGARVAFASDWPVADVSVLRGLQANLTRPAYVGGKPQGLDLMAALHAYTAGGAIAAHMETLTGTLRVGMAADLVLIDGDLEATPADQVGQRGIALTVAGGRIIHQAHGFA